MALKLNLRNIPGKVGWEVGLMEGAPRKYQGKLSLPGRVTFSCLSTLSKRRSVNGDHSCFPELCGPFLAHFLSPPTQHSA